ncbi:MAG: coenzyme F420-0:L-glutamate ligase [Firmicutes bacterium]|jgi:hypothetical protein|nr:coenzyme F420-0:L-glutamate ligase [Bacillota bacterium]MCL5063914.1 coenzyme F420-0:L-glutamate ligase [Bacillota bacterium]
MTEPELGSMIMDDWIEKPAQTVGGRRFRRYVVHTHLVAPNEKLSVTLLPYLRAAVGPKDIVLISEKIVAISEGRARSLDSIKVRGPARLLSRYIGPLGYGLGLNRPETMQMAIAEAGLWRIGVAAVVGAFDRLIGRSGDFYRIAGRRVAAIDGPGPDTIEPYNQFVVLAPLQSQTLARTLSSRLSRATVAIVDVNDVGSEVIAVYGPADPEWVRALTHDNPMGQGGQGTPVAVFRPLPSSRRPPPWNLDPNAEGAGTPVASWPGLGQIEPPELPLNCI